MPKAVWILLVFAATLVPVYAQHAIPEDLILIAPVGPVLSRPIAPPHLGFESLRRHFQGLVQPSHPLDILKKNSLSHYPITCYLESEPQVPIPLTMVLAREKDSSFRLSFEEGHRAEFLAPPSAHLEVSGRELQGPHVRDPKNYTLRFDARGTPLLRIQYTDSESYFCGEEGDADLDLFPEEKEKPSHSDLWAIPKLGVPQATPRVSETYVVRILSLPPPRKCPPCERLYHELSEALAGSKVKLEKVFDTGYALREKLKFETYPSTLVLRLSEGREEVVKTFFDDGDPAPILEFLKSRGLR